MRCVELRSRWRKRGVRLRFWAALAALLAGLVACGPDGEQGTDRTEQSRPREESGQRAQPAPRSAAPAEGGETGPRRETTAPSADLRPWDYVALGDSLAAGVGANRGYVERYAARLSADTGIRVRVTNLGISGQTSSQLLDALRNDPTTRRSVRSAEIITFNIGINDLGRAGDAYNSGGCGGVDGQRCLKVAVERFKANWDGVTAEILGLSSPGDTVIRTPGLGYTPQVGGVFGPYVAQVNEHIADSATSEGIPYVQVRIGEAGMGPDGVHPNAVGYALMSERLQSLGYGPSSPPG